MKKDGFVFLILCFFLMATEIVHAETSRASKEDIKQFCDNICSEDGVMYYGADSKYSSSEQGSTENYDNRVRVHKSMFDLSFVYWVYYLAYYAITLLLAVLIYKHAKTRNDLALNLSPFMWGAVVFVNPALGLLAYWVMNVMDVSKLLGRNDVQA